MTTFDTTGTELLQNHASYTESISVCRRNWYGNPHQPTPYRTYTDSGVGVSEAEVVIRRGVKNANHKQRIAAGEIVISPYYMRKGFYAGGSITYLRNQFDPPPWNGNDYDYTGTVYAPKTIVSSILAKTFFGGPETDSLESEARTEALSNLGKASFEMGVFLLEGRESFKMLIDRYDKLVRIVARGVIQSKQRAKSSDPKVWIKYFADAWLRERYGVMPLMRDLEELINLDRPKPKIREISLGNSHTRSETNTHAGSFSVGDFSSWTSFRTTGIETLHQSAKVGVFANYSVHNPLWWLCRDLGLSTPTSIALELTRLSFIFDWFANLGSYIQSYELSAGVQPEAAWANVKSEYSLDLQAFVTTGNAGNTVEQYAGSLGVINMTEHCRVKSSFELPALPTIRVKLNALRILDSISLLTQVVYNRVR